MARNKRTNSTVGFRSITPNGRVIIGKHFKIVKSIDESQPKHNGLLKS